MCKITVVLERVSNHNWLPPWVRHQHEARYDWAAERVRNAVVIDVACGTGYGAQRLVQQGALSVRGFDISQHAIDQARSVNSLPTVSFAVGDATRLPIPKSTVDIYLSFETIEHIPDDNAYLVEAQRVLKPDGWFLCSTPNRVLTNPGTTLRSKPFNPHHVREYCVNEFLERCSSHFSRVSLYGQSWYNASYVALLTRAASVHPMLAVRVHQLRKLAGCFYETRQRHWPQLVSAARGTPEILIAACQP